MKQNLGNVTVNVESADFGSMGFSLNPLDWFSSPKEFTRSQNIAAANAWLTRVYNELKPNATYSKFIDSLKLDNYDQKISDADYQDFLDSLGFNINTSSAIADKVRASIIKSFSANKNMLPTRRSIMSAFLNPDVVKWTYWDALKVSAQDAKATAVATVQTVSDAVSSTAGVLSFIVKNRIPIIILGLAGVGYFIYRNRNLVGERLNERALATMGLGRPVLANPKKTKRAKKRRK